MWEIPSMGNWVLVESNLLSKSRSLLVEELFNSKGVKITPKK